MGGGIECDAIRPGHGATGKVACSKTDHPLLAGACKQIEVHHPWCAGHRRLTAELRGSGWSEAEALAPGHGVWNGDRFSLAAAPQAVNDR